MARRKFYPHDEDEEEKKRQRMLARMAKARAHKKRGRRKNVAVKPAPLLISRPDSAALLGCDKQTLIRREKAGLLEGIRLNPLGVEHGLVHYRYADIMAIVQGKAAPKFENHSAQPDPVEVVTRKRLANADAE